MILQIVSNCMYKIFSFNIMNQYIHAYIRYIKYKFTYYQFKMDSLYE